MRKSTLVDITDWGENFMSSPGVFTPSQGVITYCDYNSSEKELTLNTSEEYDVVVPGDGARDAQRN